MKNRLVAHRGDMNSYPENSLLAFTKAAELGYKYLELDIQFSKDRVPIVIHDENLIRTTGIDKNLHEYLADELVSHKMLTQDNSERISLLHIATLMQAVEILNDYPEITLFVEIKRQCLNYNDLDIVINTVTNAIQKAKFEIVIISFVKEVIETIQCENTVKTGWVTSKYDQEHHVIASNMQPDYLFCNVKKINNPSNLWEGPWKWVLYDITNPKFAYELLMQGVDFVETGDIVKLSNSEYFQ